MRRWLLRIVRRAARPFRGVVHRPEERLTARLEMLEGRLAEMSAALVQIKAGVTENREQILAARHQAYVLLTQHLDASSETATLMARGLTDSRFAIEDAVEVLQAEIEKLNGSFTPPEA